MWCVQQDSPKKEDRAWYGGVSCPIPLLVVQEPSPTRSLPPGSPPPKSPTMETSFAFATKPPRRLLKDLDKPNSLDLPCPPPVITITCNMSEVESDAEVISPGKKSAEHQGGPSASSGMTYLSPFSMCSRADRTASESNLSSSGYSSMASPGPSRCGSNNPLCPSEVEDPPGPDTSRRKQFQAQPKQSTFLCADVKVVPTPESTAGENDPMKETVKDIQDCVDSETQSDDPFVESNDEGIGTDHLDEKIEEGELKSAKELQVFIGKELVENVSDVLSIAVPALAPVSVMRNSPVCRSVENLLSPLSSVCKSSLQLPSIVIQNDVGPLGEKHLSPVSSRSESPLSDKIAGPGRFSPLFYGRHKEQLPYTDSDGLYDCPSSDCPKMGVGSAPVQQHRKSTGRRREKRSASRSFMAEGGKASKAGSPTKAVALLDVPGKDQYYRPAVPRKHSPKRTRVRTQSRVSSSSSSESLVSAR
ncbi:hypothetical protein PR048_000063 [Dryococelus australis]|uniref:Uncharacterized protein n=1 Tax=Dryococelus australis TaxID=614101 RepID=A0ABQ9IEJ4_9NEOP|nr:hypothetical protein PR048_000063 [Dryococelus australis]